MARKKQSTPEGGRAARGSGKRGTAHNPTRPGKANPEGTGNASGVHGHEAPAAPSDATERPPPGLDDAKHAAAQRAANQAEIMRQTLFPAIMADALGYEGTFEARAYKVFLDQLIEESGAADPIERLILQQLALAHFRIGQLHVSAGQAKSVEGVKVLNAAAARMLGEFRRTALALRAYRTRVPEDKPEKNLKLFKAAQ